MGEVLADFSPLRDIPAILGHPWHNFAPLRDNSASLGQPCAAPRQESPKLAGKSQCGGFSMRDRFVDAARNPPEFEDPSTHSRSTVSPNCFRVPGIGTYFPRVFRAKRRSSVLRL